MAWLGLQGAGMLVYLSMPLALLAAGKLDPEFGRWAVPPGWLPTFVPAPVLLPLLVKVLPDFALRAPEVAASIILLLICA